MIRKQLFIEDFGNITLEKKSRQKSLRLRIHPERGIFVSVPLHLSDSEAKKFVIKNLDWLKSKKSQLEKNKNIGFFDENSVFTSREHKLIIERSSEEGIKTEIKNGIIRIFINHSLNIKNANTQKFIEKAILKALRIEGNKYLPTRLETLAEKYGFKYSGIRIGTAGKTWGTCKSNNFITLSGRLMLLPDELIDYIILHELCHTVHKNHSKKFHELLNHCTNGNSKLLNKKMKNYSSKIVPVC